MRASTPDSEPEPATSGWFWATLMLSSVSLVGVVFAAWELFEHRFFRDADYVQLHGLYVTRGVASSLLLAAWAAWYVLRQRRHSEEELRRSWQRYRGLLEASPGAVALYDSELSVAEWNAAAERLYGYTKAEVLGRRLPTVPADKDGELGELLRRVEQGRSVLDVETVRVDQAGARVEIQLSLLQFNDPGGANYFLEVSSDIRERVRLRQRLVEIEKLTSMGKMAAGTAHHLNTPLAATLLRVQMMRETPGAQPLAQDLERLESDLRFCQHFVRRLLEFTRRPESAKQPHPVGVLLESVLSFLGPVLSAKGVRASLDVNGGRDAHVLADRNLLETVFLALISNALDAVPSGGEIAVSLSEPGAGHVTVRIADNGAAIKAADMPRLFEPFFTTKEPGKGTGLGLAIARNIVVEHGGSIRIGNRAEGGVEATVELPRCETPTEARP